MRHNTKLFICKYQRKVNNIIDNCLQSKTDRRSTLCHPRWSMVKEIFYKILYGTYVDDQTETLARIVKKTLTESF